MENITINSVKVENNIYLTDHNYYIPPSKCV